MERISVFDIFKIGVGPSSSHTMGPWKAALEFVKELQSNNAYPNIESVSIKLFGSLSKTGKGHGTDIAVMLGLCGFNPETIDTTKIDDYILNIQTLQKLNLNSKKIISFDPKTQIEFLDIKLPFHPNALTFYAYNKEELLLERTFYSVGGGFIVGENISADKKSEVELPYPTDNEKDLIKWLIATNSSKISDIVWKNELQWRSEEEIKSGLLRIWQTMKECIFRGCHTSGELPGGLFVQRRAQKINERLLKDKKYTNIEEWTKIIQQQSTQFDLVTTWISAFALAVNEENASFGRIVTAPTNGAAGVIPAVLMYYLCFTSDATDDKIINFLITAGEIGSIFKKGSTISAAMGGCQAEIGVSSAMAAAALTECLGGTPRQALMAAEIAMEHHLGLTCDPVNGLVQIPCIERNTMGAMKAITASQIALNSDPSEAKVTLDSVIKTMWETAQDMHDKYKETSDGGLAINVSVIVPEC